MLSKRPSVIAYQNIQSSINQLEQVPLYSGIKSLSYKNEQTNSLEESLEDYRDELKETIASLQKDTEKIKNSSEYKDYRKKRYKISAVFGLPYLIFMTSVLTHIFYGKKKIKIKNELKRKKDYKN